MLLITKVVSYFPMIHGNFQVIEFKTVSMIERREPQKKGNAFLKVCLQKLLKTHVEKMSAFWFEQKLLKTKES